MKSRNFDIVILEANIRDLALLRHWDTQEHIVESDPNDDWNWETELNRNVGWRAQFIAELIVNSSCNPERPGLPFGFIQIIDPQQEETNYWQTGETNLRALDIWIGEKINLGLGYGTIMMNLALDHCFKDKTVTSVLVDPLTTNTKAHRFYEQLGFKLVEKRQFGQDVCLVYRLERNDWIPK